MPDKKEYVIHIRNLKQTLNHGLVLKKVYRLIKFNQKAWLIPYTDMSAELRKKTKNDFEKYFLKLMNNSVFGKAMENVREHKDIRLAAKEKRRNYLVSEPIYHTPKLFSGNLLTIEMKNPQKLMNKPVYLGLSILELSKIEMRKFW